MQSVRRGPPPALVSAPLLLAGVFFCILGPCSATLDLTLANLESVADRIAVDECRRLVAALRIHTFEYPGDGAVDTKERLLEDDSPCLERLIRWNSEEGEGRGETHEVLTRRLRQMGHEGLADDLSKAVYGAITDSLRSANDELPKGVTLPQEESEGGGDPFAKEREEECEEEAAGGEWGVADTVLLFAASLLVIAVILLAALLLWRRIAASDCCGGGREGAEEGDHSSAQLLPPPQ